ncbi:MAG: hypothetical protein A2451_01930 [Bdellovibrionales bacterium RIFOXYC2_FULL_39_8]|nr:MAG: hypothetical protein A2451_01930 [Bdellovibrionales bacterium RIFOXYC2_FULL_39_8]
MVKRQYEILVLLLILTFAFNPLADLMVSLFFNTKRIDLKSYANIWDTTSIIMPLLLCLTSLKRSGLVIGEWKLHHKKILLVCLTPIILTLIVYPFTSKPFHNERVGVWLISPIAQDLFGGYMYGALDEVFPKRICWANINYKQAVPLVALFGSLWHLHNFQVMAASFVLFQLIYIFIFAFWVYLTRQWTGSILPVWITHVCVNFICWWF